MSASARIAVRPSADGLLEITLSRTDRANALDDAMVEALSAAVLDAYRDDTRVVVLRGAGRHFCSGFDLSRSPASPTQSDARSLMAIETLLQLVWDVPCVTIALVHGATLGAGADLAVACDYRVAIGPCRISFPGFGKSGVLLGTRRLAQTVGAQPAFDLVLRSREVSREEALCLGLLSDGSDGTDADAFIASVVAAAKGRSKAQIAALKRAVRNSGADYDIARIPTTLAG